MISRIGTYFLIIGGFLIFLFWLIEEKNEQSLQLLCLGVPMISLGIWFWNRDRDRTPADRFRTWKKLRNRKKD